MRRSRSVPLFILNNCLREFLLSFFLNYPQPKLVFVLMYYRHLCACGPSKGLLFNISLTQANIIFPNSATFQGFQGRAQGRRPTEELAKERRGQPHLIQPIAIELFFIDFEQFRRYQSISALRGWHACAKCDGAGNNPWQHDDLDLRASAQLKTAWAGPRVYKAVLSLTITWFFSTTANLAFFWHGCIR
jgi:hypothetical protein